MTDLTDCARRFLLGIGLLSFVVGIVVLIIPSEGVVGWPWADDTLLVGFFTVAFVIASLLVPFTFLSGAPAGKTARPPERVPLTDTPGDDLMVLDRRLWLPIPRSRRRQVRSRLQQAAIRTLVRTADCSVADAEAQIEMESWTDDGVAAGFVRSESESVLDHLLFPRRARRAAQAILEESETGADRQ